MACLMLIKCLVSLTVFSSLFVMAFANKLDARVDERKRLNHVIDSLDLLIYTCLLILTIVTYWVFKQRRLRFIHESGLAVIYGLVIGFFLRIIGTERPFESIGVVPEVQALFGDRMSGKVTEIPPDEVILKMNISVPDEDSRFQEKAYSYAFKSESSDSIGNALRERATFNPELFFYILLPPIIFHAGYSMRKKHFFANFGAILAFALIGTTISTIVIGVIMYGFGQLIPVNLTFVDTLYFGAIISATDPVTTLAIFQVIELIHEADPQSRPVVIIVFAHVIRPPPSVPTF